MSLSLGARASLALAILGLVLALLLFVPAGTVRYGEGWIYLSIFMVASAATTADLARRDPALLSRRLHGGPAAEGRPAQKVIMLFTSIGFIALLVVPALDFRSGRSTVPRGLAALGDVLVLVGFALIARVYRENSYASATVQVSGGQTVISTGPYAVVRHPMYASALLYLAGTPLALGSWRGLIAFAAILPFIGWRLLDEERLLVRELPGYAEYRQRVRYRLVPLVW